MNQESIKRTVGYAAAEFIQPSMKVGIGTGSTVLYFIERLAQKCREGLVITAIASSKHSAELAKKQGIPLLKDEEFSSLDITIDGADEIDPDRHMIKGGGGALFREKILSYASKTMIAIVDESKLVTKLGKCKLPIEILPFGVLATIHHLKDKHFNGSLRKTSSGALYQTDNGNYIFDIQMKEEIVNYHQTDLSLRSIPGVVETGLFIHVAHKVLIGLKNGTVIER